MRHFRHISFAVDKGSRWFALSDQLNQMRVATGELESLPKLCEAYLLDGAAQAG
jgi:hypothetical protein